MTHEEFFNKLLEMVKDSSVDFQELRWVGDEEDVFVRFTNIQAEEGDDT